LSFLLKTDSLERSEDLNIMPTRTHTAETARLAREYQLGRSGLDPLSKLTDAVQQEMLKTADIKSAKGGDYIFVLHSASTPQQKKLKTKPADAFRESVSKALRSVLLRDDSAGRVLRLQLVQHLASPELNEPNAVELSVRSAEPALETDDPLLTTSETAQRLGFSRAHIAMLVDADRLQAEHKSEGGHRRIRLSEVLRYQQELQAKHKSSSSHEQVGRDASMYAIPDSEWVAISREQRISKTVENKLVGKKPKRPPARAAAKQSKMKG